MNTPSDQHLPYFERDAFICPSCNAFAQMKWDRLFTKNSSFSTNLFQAKCARCSGYSVWVARGVLHGPTGNEGVEANMVHPSIAGGPPPHAEMPELVRNDYEEARAVVHQSPRAACALLRLCVQRICKELGEEGKNINQDIRSLVEKGLPPEVQKALDIVRVVGNNSVHPGSIDDKDLKDHAFNLFKIINFIVEDRISRPKQLHAMYESLPERDRQSIARRDGL